MIDQFDDLILCEEPFGHSCADFVEYDEIILLRSESICSFGQGLNGCLTVFGKSRIFLGRHKPPTHLNRFNAGEVFQSG